MHYKSAWYSFFFIFVFNSKYESIYTTMNGLFTKRIGALASALVFISTVSFSQFDKVDFLKSAPADGAKFLQAYISPWANAFSAGLNGGWYNTAKPHKFGGFDITTGINVGVVPTSADKFEISSIGLSSAVTGSGLTSTVSGPNTNGPSMSYMSNTVPNVELANFKAPPGSGWRYMPVPTLQVGLGLPFGTEIKGRFIPKITIKDGSVSLWGIGLLHSIVQYFPGSKLLPFDVSLFAGYTKLESNIPLTLKPDPAVTPHYSTYNLNTSFNDQNMEVNVSALNISAIASLNLPVVTFYGGIGYCKTKTDMALTGYFPTPTLAPGPPPFVDYNDSGVKKGSDFPSMKIENFSGLRANIGLRIKLAVITIHADYTKAQYNVFSTGFGISFR